MELNAVVAMSENRVIGNENKLPWNMPADLQHFKKITLNQAIIMGRKTYDSIGQPLPKRENYILTRNANLTITGCHTITDITQCPHQTAFLIGGAQLFHQYMQQINILHLTIIHHSFVGDTYFPALDDSQWKTIDSEHHCADKDNPYDYTFKTLQSLHCIEIP